jgi:nitrate reductase assembly molybdenum cofactor insertion protein NarJ
MNEAQMTHDLTIRRAQLYRFLADAFLYPTDNWLEDLPHLDAILFDLGLGDFQPPVMDFSLSALQEEHRRTFGLTGSLCYETEFGLPDEFRQSQEMADIAGFYHAFGFRLGGTRHERPDHLAIQLEFLYVLSLKEAAAGIQEHVEVCIEARKAFLRDHLGRWIGLLAEGVARGAALTAGQEADGTPYVWLARLAAAFVEADAQSLGVTPQVLLRRETAPTPLPTDISCESCPVAE